MDRIFPCWQQLQHGDAVDLVLQVVVIEKDGVLCKTLNKPFQTVLVKDLEAAIVSNSNVVVVVGAKLIDSSAMPIVEVGQTTIVHPMSNYTAQQLHRVVDLCCGMGFFSSVTRGLNMQTIAGVDVNPKWKPLFCQMHPNASFVVGDVGDRQVYQQLLQCGAEHAWTVAGVACQPHSKAGDGKGMADPRSLSMPFSLKMGWLLQSPVIILECVAEVLKNAEFQSILRNYCMATGCRLFQKVLHLSEVWPTSRTRWFGILTSPVFEQVEIPDLPRNWAKTTVEEVMPFLKAWPRDQHEQIELTLYELAKFYEFAPGGIEQLHIQMKGRMATFLHSAGNQLFPCKCGCRGPFSLERLASKGLFATLIPLAETTLHINQHMRHCRYLHPIEMMLLNGSLPQDVFGNDLRLGLAAVGQSVSQIQATWIFSHVKNVVAAFLRQQPVDVCQHLSNHVQEVLQARDDFWVPPTAMQVEEQLTDFAVYEEESDSTIHFRGMVTQTVSMFTAAEAKLRCCDGANIRVASATDLDLPGDASMASHESIRLPLPFVPREQAFVPQCPCAEWESPDQVPMEISATVPFQVEDLVPCAAVQEPSWAQLSSSGLVKLMCPVVSSREQVSHLLKQMIPKEIRIAVLEQQGFVLADDEIRFLLDRKVSQASSNMYLFTWDPLILTCVVRHGHLHLLQALADWMPSEATIVTAISIEQHWYPVVWQWENKQLIGMTCGHAGNFSLALQQVHNVMCRLLNCQPTTLQYYPIAFAVTQCCGALVDAFCDFIIYQCPLPSTMMQLQEHHARLRNDFVASLTTATPRPWIWGAGEQLWQQTLAVLLQDHGVAAEDVDARVKLLQEKLGTSALAKAIQSPVPWRELKWLANSVSPIVQIIKPTELQSAIDRKVQQGGVVGSRAQKKQAKGKSGGKGKAKGQHVDPSSLRLEPGVFECGEKIALGQIDIGQIGPNANGIVLCTKAQAAPYLKSNRSLTAGGLAVIIVDGPDALPPTTLVSQQVRVPVICLANSEPALIDGVMFQLGNLPVRRCEAVNKFELVSISSSVVKIMVFRDQTDTPWSQVVAHPLKHVFARIPVLQRCGDDECDGSCEAWHSTESCQLSDPILELWGRQFIQLNFQQVAPEKAEVYQVHLRVPQVLQTQLQTYSGVGGVYLEPRGLDGKKPSDHFEVVWMPRITFDALQVLKQTTPGVLGLARLGSKFGLRCLATQASELHAILKPGSAYLPQGKKQFYLLGPVPFGTLKSSITTVLESIGWQARAVHAIPAAAHVHGVMWKIQAIEHPSRTLISTAQGDLLVTKLDEPQAVSAPATNVIAAAPTLHLCTSARSSSVDPLQEADPWAVSARLLGPPQKPMQLQATDQIEKLQQQVIDAVMAKIPKEMEVDSGNLAADSRLTVLEKQVQELHVGQASLAAVVSEQGATHQCQMAQLHQQTTQLEVAVQEHSDHISSFQVQFQAQLDKQQHSLDSMFSRQMLEFKEMLGAHKKARME